MTVLIDTNVVVDILTRDPVWFPPSWKEVSRIVGQDSIAINHVVYAELAAGYGTLEDVDAAVRSIGVIVLPLRRPALFLAGKAFKRYRQAGGTRTGVLSDFFIGAQAESEGLALLTRDPKRYRTYFPSVELIVPAP